MRIHHIALRVADCARSRAFYSGLLGLPELRRYEREGVIESVWLKAGDAILMLERSLRGHGAEDGSGHLLAFAVQDLETWEQRLIAARTGVEDRTAHTLYFRDPDGHRVGLSTNAVKG